MLSLETTPFKHAIHPHSDFQCAGPGGPSRRAAPPRSRGQTAKRLRHVLRERQRAVEAGPLILGYVKPVIFAEPEKIPVMQEVLAEQGLGFGTNPQGKKADPYSEYLPHAHCWERAFGASPGCGGKFQGTELPAWRETKSRAVTHGVLSDLNFQRTRKECWPLQERLGSRWHRAPGLLMLPLIPASQGALYPTPTLSSAQEPWTVGDAFAVE
ncbi:hypothetical protein Q8A67_021589 [Cirrhinus molitorella]|uniref:Uncharacterized protein n=1 Tax=Cirrhinus molitorella TaxID=172907 RepID=A0AA88TEJ6_9TELE|nr:hypothetical protein Q8A67_021589 [Cirrhinus molitorella]